jgi:hypothetical protein
MKHYEYIADIVVIGGSIVLFGMIIYGIFDLLKTAIACTV